jgi:hypothetical protein
MAEDKHRQWALIRAEAPDLAGFLVEINRAFGKPAGVRVTWGDVVIEAGSIELSGNEWDGRLRPPRYG